MTASTVYSENVTNIIATPSTSLERKKANVKTVIDQKAVATTSIDEAADTILFGPIPSNAVILDVQITNDDLDSHATPTLAVDCGLVYSGIGGNQLKNGKTIGTAVDVDCFASAATTLQAATTTWTSLRFEADDIVDVKKEAWEAGGLSSDPGGLFYINLTVTTGAATAAAGDIVMRITYI